MKQSTNDFFNDLLTMDELLSLLRHQYSKHTIYRLIQKEEMPYLKLKGRLWFSKSSVCLWLQRSSK